MDLVINLLMIPIVMLFLFVIFILFMGMCYGGCCIYDIYDHGSSSVNTSSES